MACERSCSVTISDRRIMSQYHSFVILLDGVDATRPTYNLRFLAQTSGSQPKAGASPCLVVRPRPAEIMDSWNYCSPKQAVLLRFCTL